MGREGRFSCPQPETCCFDNDKTWVNQDEFHGHLLEYHSDLADSMGLKKLECPRQDCNKTFVCHSNLTRHMKKVHARTIWACTHCWGAERNSSGSRRDNIKNRHSKICSVRKSAAATTKADFKEFANEQELAAFRAGRKAQGAAPAPVLAPTPAPTPAPVPAPATAAVPALPATDDQPTEGLTVGPLPDNEAWGVAVCLQQYIDSGATDISAWQKMKAFHDSIVNILNQAQAERADEWYFNELKASLI